MSNTTPVHQSSTQSTTQPSAGSTQATNQPGSSGTQSSININQLNQIGQGGIQDSLRGIDYQLKLLQLFPLDAFNKSLDFSCWTEDPKAEKFDDVIFKKVINNSDKFSFLQAKSRLNPFLLNFKTFFIDKNYVLYKYFISFVKLEANFGIDYNNVDLDDLIICTNNTIPPPVNGLLKLSDVKLKLDLHFEILDNHEVFGSLGIKYKFGKNRFAENLEFLKNHFIAIELAKLLFEYDSPVTYLLKFSQSFLATNVFEITGNKISFREEFLTKNFSHMKSFRNHFQFVINNGFVKITGSQKNKLLNDFWKFFRNMNLNQDDYFISTIQSFTTDQNYVDSKIKIFLENFLIVSNLTKSDIEQNIQSKISVIFKHISNFHFPHLKLSDAINDWLKNDSATPIDTSKICEIYKFYIQDLKEKFFCIKVPGFTCLKQELPDFLNSTDPNDKILIYHVAEGETFYGCIRFFQIDESIVYLKSDYHAEDFRNLSRLIANSSKKVCFLIECTDEMVNLLSSKTGFMLEVERNPNVKLIIVCDSNNIQHFGGYKEIIQDTTLCRELTNDSLTDYLEKKINFQGSSLKLSELIDVNVLQTKPLKDVENLKRLGGELKKPEIYLPRNLCRKIYLKEAIVKDFESKKFQDLLCFTENDYKNQQITISPIHLVENIFSKVSKLMKNAGVEPTLEKVLWKDSKLSINTLRSYIHKNDPINIAEDEYLSPQNQIILVTAIAGMGKSMLFQNLAYELKQNNLNYWIEKVDLRIYCDEFELFQDNNVKDKGNGEIQQYFYDQILKFENSLKEEIFKYLLNKGRTILLFDGFDEICETYKSSVIAIICALMEVSQGNRFFISTRPEWCETLENEYLQFAYSLYSFSESDQQEYLLKLWKKDNSWEHIAKLVLERLNNSITDKEKSFTGVPLITKLIGLFYTDSINDESLKTDSSKQQELISCEFTLYGLLNHFIDTKIKIYCNEKLGIKVANPNARMFLRTLRLNHLKLSYKILFPSEFTQVFERIEEFDEETLMDLTRCGLLEFVNQQLNFLHQTIAECLVTNHIKEKFNELKVLKFVLTVVLVGNGYKLIRSLINGFIQKVTISDENRNQVRELIPKALIIAAKEVNTETFDFFFDIFTENSKLPKESMVDLLLEKDLEGYNMFLYYFYYCNVSIDFLDKLKNRFGLNFIVDLLQIKNGPIGRNIIDGASLNGKNYFALVKWIIQNYPANFQVIKEIICTKDHFGNTILHNSTNCFDKNSFISFLNEIKIFESSSNQDFLDSLILMKNSENDTFLHCWSYNLPGNETETNNANDLIEIIEWMTFNSKVLEELILSKDSDKNCLIHLVATKFRKNLLQILKSIYKSTNSKEILKAENMNGEIFLKYLVVEDSKNEATDAIIEIFDWLKELDSNLLNDFVFWKDSSGGNLLQSYCKLGRKKDLLNLTKKLTNWFQSNIPNFELIEFLKEKNGFNISFLNLIVVDDEENEATDTIIAVLDWLKKLDSNLLMDLVYGKNDFDRNLIQAYCHQARKKDLLNLIKQLTNWLQTNIANFDLIQYLKEKDYKGNSFLSLIALNDEENEATDAIIAVLEWLKELNLLTDFVNWKNFSERNLIHCYCDFGRKKDLLSLIKKLTNWLQTNVPTFNLIQFLKEKDIRGNSFINTIVLYDEHNEATDAIIEIFEWLKGLDSNLLFDLVYGRNIPGRTLIHFFFKWSVKRDLLYVLQQLTCWLQTNISDFDMSQFLKEKDNNGNLFFNFIVIHDDYNEAPFEIIPILDWLKELSMDLIEEIFCSKDRHGRNLIAFFCELGDINDLPIILKYLLGWLKLNMPDLNLEDYLVRRCNQNRIFLNEIVVRVDSSESEKNQLIQEILDMLKEFDVSIYNRISNDVLSDSELNSFFL